MEVEKEVVARDSSLEKSRNVADHFLAASRVASTRLLKVDRISIFYSSTLRATKRSHRKFIYGYTIRRLIQDDFP